MLFVEHFLQSFRTTFPPLAVGRGFDTTHSFQEANTELNPQIADDFEEA